ncbi:MAG: NAD(P)H-quinone oxidoreductase subunit 4, partial [Synechococcales cyanobacterium]
SMLRQLFYAANAAPTCDLPTKNPAGGFSSSLPSFLNQEAVCFGTSCVIPSQAKFEDAVPRELFIAISFLVLIIGIGCYPKLATQLYDAKTVALNAEIRTSYSKISQSDSSLYANYFFKTEVDQRVSTIVGLVD